jgi:hypothetical protein
MGWKSLLSPNFAVMYMTTLSRNHVSAKVTYTVCHFPSTCALKTALLLQVPLPPPLQIPPIHQSPVPLQSHKVIVPCLSLTCDSCFF